MVSNPALLIVATLLAQATQPADPTLDWLLEQASAGSSATTQPTSAPTTQPASPFQDRPQAGERAGTVELSDGRVLKGVVRTTPGKPIRVWSEARKEYLDLSIDSIAKLEAVVLWERDEPEWRFKESGHDEKVYTGKTYPARETAYKVTLTTGDVVEGGIVAPLYVKADGKTTQHVLNKRSKGEVGKTLAELVYVRAVMLD
jgi:hypothetical protein